jgi:DNA-binding LacI/PurR family transcriptional regulator
MRQIAEALGLSIATVSRAMADSPKVKPETISLVRAKANELGYEPDAALASLNAYRQSRQLRQAFQSTIAWLTNYPTEDGWREVWSSVKLFEALQTRASTMGYRIEHFWLHPDRMPMQRVHQILQARGVRGIFLPSVRPDGPALDFPWRRYAMVALSESVLTPEVHSVQRSGFFDIRTAVTRFCALGYRKPILAVHRRYHAGMHGIDEAAFRAATSEFLGEPQPYFFTRREDLGREIARQLESNEVDSVLCTLLPDHLFDLPAKLPYWASLNLTDPQHPTPGVCLTFDSIAEVALNTLVTMIHRGEYGVPEHPVVVRIKGHWNEGASG